MVTRLPSPFSLCPAHAEVSPRCWPAGRDLLVIGRLHWVSPVIATSIRDSGLSSPLCRPWTSIKPNLPRASSAFLSGFPNHVPATDNQVLDQPIFLWEFGWRLVPSMRIISLTILHWTSHLRSDSLEQHGLDPTIAANAQAWMLSVSHYPQIASAPFRLAAWCWYLSLQPAFVAARFPAPCALSPC
jgi:hypothetical protein